MQEKMSDMLAKQDDLEGYFLMFSFCLIGMVRHHDAI